MYWGLHCHPCERYGDSVDCIFGSRSCGCRSTWNGILKESWPAERPTAECGGGATGPPRTTAVGAPSVTAGGKSARAIALATTKLRFIPAEFLGRPTRPLGAPAPICESTESVDLVRCLERRLFSCH